MKKANIIKSLQIFRTDPRIKVLALIFLVSSVSHANTSINPMPAAQVIEEQVQVSPPMPGAEVIETTTQNVQANENFCVESISNQNFEGQIKNLQTSLGQDYKSGKTNELRTQIIEIRDNMDSISLKLFEIDSSNKELMNLISKQAIKNLEKLISLSSTIQKLAPQVRDDYVIPFAKMSSLKAEHPECFTNKSAFDYKQITSELNRLNQDLYTLQTMGTQGFITYKNQLISQLKIYNKSSERSIALIQEIPKILNSVHRDIELMLPGLELSGQYLSSL